jgi:hypothetical protein
VCASVHLLVANFHHKELNKLLFVGQESFQMKNTIKGGGALGWPLANRVS